MPVSDIQPTNVTQLGKLSKLCSSAVCNVYGALRNVGTLKIMPGTMQHDYDQSVHPLNIMYSLPADFPNPVIKTVFNEREVRIVSKPVLTLRTGKLEFITRVMYNHTYGLQPVNHARWDNVINVIFNHEDDIDHSYLIDFRKLKKNGFNMVDDRNRERCIVFKAWADCKDLDVNDIIYKIPTFH